ncbi:hypothetical protein [Geothrix limicola]|uniref:hypothetical protein n=1 Tax=Geothrix limicola TaxID=2927978 RepID=UPI0025548BA3|nr:hypothetical protein [Geothrix limicola]
MKHFLSVWVGQGNAIPTEVGKRLGIPVTRKAWMRTCSGIVIEDELVFNVVKSFVTMITNN